MATGRMSEFHYHLCLISTFGFVLLVRNVISLKMDSGILADTGMSHQFRQSHLSPNIKSDNFHEHDYYASNSSSSSSSTADIISSCQAFIDAYSLASANYTYCAIQNARPLRFCENCVDEYAKATSLYNTLMSNTVYENNNTLCNQLVLNSDRVQIIVKTQGYITGLWEDCDCENCFEQKQNSSGYIDFILSNRTILFHEKMNSTMECFNSYGKVDNAGNFSVCNKCQELYHDMNRLYEQFEHETSHHVCMDIVDMMNSTRYLWSTHYHCTMPPGDMLAVILISVFFSLMPVVFYVGSRIHGVREQQKLVKQRRVSNVNNPATPGTSRDNMVHSN